MSYILGSPGDLYGSNCKNSLKKATILAERLPSEQENQKKDPDCPRQNFHEKEHRPFQYIKGNVSSDNSEDDSMILQKLAHEYFEIEQKLKSL